MACVNWQCLDQFENANEKYDHFLNIYVELYKKCLPLKTFKNKNKNTNKKPWVTKDIVKLSKKKHLLYRKYLRNRTLVRKESYKKCRNILNNLSRESKRKYYDSKLNQYVMIRKEHGNSLITF